MTRRKEDCGVDIFRGADVSSRGSLTPRRDQRAYPGAQHFGAVGIDYGKSALDSNRNVGAADLLAIVDPDATGASDLVLLFPPVVGHSELFLPVIPRARQAMRLHDDCDIGSTAKRWARTTTPSARQDVVQIKPWPSPAA